MTPSEPGVPARRHPLAKCEECDLNNAQSIFVPSSVPASAPTLVFVGEAPGANEAVRGKPFTGPSGKLLDTVLRGHGLSRPDAYITNVCLCRPKNNATPSSRAISACADRLRFEVEQATSGGAPLVAMGNTAASAIFGAKVTITTFRVGPPKESPLYPGVKIIPTVHPAYVLRQPDAFPTFADDIGKVKHNVKVGWEPPTYRVFDEPAEARRALNQLQARNGDAVVDIEIGAEKDADFVHPDQYRLLCVGFSYAPGRAIVIGENALRPGRRNSMDPVLFAMGRVLENSNASIVAHNGKFDLAGLRFLSPNAHLGFDTMLASYAVDERPGVHGLKYLAQEKLGYPNYALELHKYIKKKGDNFAHVPREILYKYNAFDVCSTFDLKDYYKMRMTADEVKLEAMLTRASHTLMHAEMKGLRVDLDYLAGLSEKLELSLLDLEDTLAQWVNNPRSWKQVQEALAKLGLAVQSTNVHTLTYALRRTDLAVEARTFIQILLEHRKEAKLYGTYVKGILNRLYRGHVHPTFLLHGTVTGRLACRNPNLMNQPRDPKLRRMYVPDEGKRFVQGDLKGAELRVIACEAEDDYLRELFAEGRDIHNEVATRFFGPSFTKDQRVRAKAVVFGLAYGREAASLAQEFNIPISTAQGYLDAFFGLIPQTVAWRKSIEDQVLHGEEDLSTPFGRHRRIWLVTPENKYDIVKESLAFKPQAIASDICLNAAMVLHEQYGVDVRLLVHDSILAVTEKDEAEDVAQLMLKVMPQVAKDVYSDYVPFEADVKIGMHWGEV